MKHGGRPKGPMDGQIETAAGPRTMEGGRGVSASAGALAAGAREPIQPISVDTEAIDGGVEQACSCQLPAAHDPPLPGAYKAPVCQRLGIHQKCWNEIRKGPYCSSVLFVCCQAKPQPDDDERNGTVSEPLSRASLIDG